MLSRTFLRVPGLIILKFLTVNFNLIFILTIEEFPLILIDSYVQLFDALVLPEKALRVVYYHAILLMKKFFIDTTPHFDIFLSGLLSAEA